VIVEHPLDSIKVRQQSGLKAFNSDARRRDGGRPGAPGSLDVLRSTIQEEGVRALFQGIYPRLLTYSAVKMSLFAIYEGCRPLLGSAAAAGFLAGAINSCVSCPADLIKSQLQVQVGGECSPRGFLRFVVRELTTRLPTTTNDY
jgi:hypothetical protein